VRHRVCDAVLDASKLLVMSLQVNSRPLFLLVDGWPIQVSACQDLKGNFLDAMGRAAALNPAKARI